jgi:hypothetical protein
MKKNHKNAINTEKFQNAQKFRKSQFMQKNPNIPKNAESIAVLFL